MANISIGSLNPCRKKEEGTLTAMESQVLVESSPFNKEQVEMLQKLLQDSMQSAPRTATVAQKGNSLTALSARTGSSTPWIVDSGASDHMTGDATVLSTYSPCTGNTTVKIADGISSKVVGTGLMVISKDIILKPVLFVPILDCNLLSISKLTKDLNCVAKFLPNLCEF